MTHINLHLVERKWLGGAYARRYVLPKKGDRSHPHRHTIGHFTTICGLIRAYREWEQPLDCTAGSLLAVPPFKLHQFEALEDNATYVCTLRLRYPDGRYVEDDHNLSLDELDVLANNLTVRELIPGVHMPAA